MSSSVIEVRDLRKTFKLGDQIVNAVDGVSFTIQPGEIVGIVGPSGSGKSTLLGLLGGLDKPDGGTVTLDGAEISRLNERELTNIRNEKLGFVFQFFNLIPNLTALENVALPIEFAHRAKFKPQPRASELLTHFGLADRLRHRPNQLSGGQQQRVAIARALANNPPILLADEPTGNLNSEASALVISTLRQVRQDFGTTVIIVTHDPDVAGEADRMLTLIDGRLVD
jgi:putative ABC transport system ATP-binding protein